MQIPLVAVLTHPTIVELDALISHARASGTFDSLPKAKDLTLSAAQQRLWFLDEFIPNRSAYNIPLARRIRGTVDMEALQKALAAVSMRHATLRSSFSAQEDGAAVIAQTNAPRFSFQLLAALDESQAMAMANEEAGRQFRLAERAAGARAGDFAGQRGSHPGA